MPVLWLVILAMQTWTAFPGSSCSAELEPLQEPGFNERLNQVLDGEGGVQIYKDQAGNVGVTIVPPTGERKVTVQPPQSPSINVGPPLQLHQNPLIAPPPLTPSAPPDRDFPQRAH